MQIFYPDSMFSSASSLTNTISHSFSSLPDGPWPSQPYLHRLAGPTSFHRCRLLAGKTYLHSMSFFFLIPFCFYRAEDSEGPQQSYTMSDPMVCVAYQSVCVFDVFHLLRECLDEYFSDRWKTKSNCIFLGELYALRCDTNVMVTRERHKVGLEIMVLLLQQ